ncbi:MAG: chromosomal replication initiator protein DnaA [Candidatus Magasanikbacteria bacterium]|jgi:chromosomal replication initiator protein|nr:chromosomal replication initiator protein DnaA [Candidatus Magasanikbacteria bacterium]MBT5262292.1 chromosomal replication initiator protein DnaA [Candidatus Magasanikbacteria bacterium]MBT5820143.1 chromosomal replication initiator protein DnaA [Candidatus Magasanikbacteria bacterium]MBT6294914.1 chromosomal replication initiator protein DnaA [Candidatus Magasanikbacteria bacterium]
MTNYEIWQAVLAEFELTLSKANFTTWFRNTGISSYDQGRILVCVPNTFTKSWLEKKYHTDLVKTIERVTGKPVKRVEYRVENIKNVTEKECITENTPAVFTQKQPAPRSTGPKNSLLLQFGLNPKYTFSSFIVGKENELAHAAAQAVASKPGDTYNPLFIYGDVGLGKTHLLQAIGQAMLAKNPQTKILYVSSEKFTNEFVTAVKEGKAKEFKHRYRTVDLLLIDDIQFIGGKEQTQEEFFHTFNELHQQGRQVVMTSDRKPKAIPALEARLRSRFEWGMIADISVPNMETRSAILQAKCQEKGFSLSENLINIIAVSIESNVRELEGALNKIIAIHQLKNTPTTEESVREILVGFAAQHAKPKATPSKILDAAAKYFELSKEDLLGKSREKKISYPRQVVMYLLRKELSLSFPAIGQELGGRDHTTAIHAYKKIVESIEKNEKIQQDIERVTQELYAV